MRVHRRLWEWFAAEPERLQREIGPASYAARPCAVRLEERTFAPDGSDPPLGADGKPTDPSFHILYPYE